MRTLFDVDNMPSASNHRRDLLYFPLPVSSRFFRRRECDEGILIISKRRLILRFSFFVFRFFDRPMSTMSGRLCDVPKRALLLLLARPPHVFILDVEETGRLILNSLCPPCQSSQSSSSIFLSTSAIAAAA
jgi:hypothetical protein